MQEKVESLPGQTEVPDEAYAETTSTGLPVTRPGPTPEEQRNDIAIRDEELMRQRMLAVFGEIRGESVNNFVGDARQQLQLESIACSGAVVKGDERLNEPIAIRYVYCHKIMVNGPTAGEYVDSIRTVLIDKDMKCWAFVSDGVATEVARILLRLGRKPFDPPYVVKAVRQTTRLGRTFITLVPVL